MCVFLNVYSFMVCVFCVLIVFRATRPRKMSKLFTTNTSIFFSSNLQKYNCNYNCFFHRCKTLLLLITTNEQDFCTYSFRYISNI